MEQVSIHKLSSVLVTAFFKNHHQNVFIKSCPVIDYILFLPLLLVLLLLPPPLLLLLLLLQLLLLLDCTTATWNNHTLKLYFLGKSLVGLFAYSYRG